jgi:hypothetical protein
LGTPGDEEEADPTVVYWAWTATPKVVSKKLKRKE